MRAVVDGRVFVAQVLGAVVRGEAVRLERGAGRDVLLDDGDDAVDVPPLDGREYDAAALLLADDAQDPDALAPLALVVLALADLGLVDLCVTSECVLEGR
jgi:hypothetical protein